MQQRIDRHSVNKTHPGMCQVSPLPLRLRGFKTNIFSFKSWGIIVYSERHVPSSKLKEKKKWVKSSTPDLNKPNKLNRAEAVQ